MSDTIPTGALAYVVKEFPVVSETFILNEMRAMEGDGLPLVVLSLKRPPVAIRHASVAELAAPVLYAPRGWRGVVGLARAHTATLLRAPRRYGKQWRRQLATPLREWLRRPSRERWRRLVKRCRRLSWATWIADLSSRHRLAHLHAHYATEPLRTAQLVRKLSATSYSFTAHAKDLFTTSASRLRRLARSAEFAVTCHQVGADHLRSAVGEEIPTLYVRHGVDTELFSAHRTDSRPARVPGTILAIGRLTAKKGFDRLIRACALLGADGRTVRCQIIGEGSLERELRELIDQLALRDVVEILPFVPQEELPARLSQAGVFVLPAVELADGNRDGLPNVIAEAMACGTPIVASEVGGIPEAIRSGVDGLLVPPGEPIALAAAIGRLLDDPGAAQRLGDTAAQRVRGDDYRSTNRPLAEQFRRQLAARVEHSLDEAEKRAWSGGLARKARKRVGLRPKLHPAAEAVIRRAVTPGLQANSWRDDLAHLAERRLWDEVVKARRVPKLLAELGPRPSGGKVLDLGCGRGGLTVALAARGLDVVGLDLRARNCTVTRLRSQRYGLDVPALPGVGERLPFADGSFDTVFCLEVLEHVQDPAALLAEIRRVLSPDGVCLVTVINRWAHFDPHYHLWGINFLPRSWANAYIRLRGRTKESYRDCQTLDEMHYFGYRQFQRFAASCGLAVEDPGSGARGWRALRFWVRRRLSIGFNTVQLVLRRDDDAAPKVAQRSFGTDPVERSPSTLAAARS